jgi:hypothetical protein
MTDLQKLVEQWAKEAGLLLTAPCLPELWKNFALLAMQYAAEEAAKIIEAEAQMECRGLESPAAIRERFKAL